MSEHDSMYLIRAVNDGKKEDAKYLVDFIINHIDEEFWNSGKVNYALKSFLKKNKDRKTSPINTGNGSAAFRPNFVNSARLSRFLRKGEKGGAAKTAPARESGSKVYFQQMRCPRLSAPSAAIFKTDIR